MDKLLSLLKSLTKEGGIVLLSTPNGLFNNGNMALFCSKFHVWEYSPAEFYSMLKKYGTVRLFCERRRDQLDVRALMHRVSNARNNIKSNEVSNVPFGKSLLFNTIFNVAYRYFNGSIFWNIHEIDPNSETKATCSTLIALLKT